MYIIIIILGLGHNLLLTYGGVNLKSPLLTFLSKNTGVKMFDELWPKYFVLDRLCYLLTIITKVKADIIFAFLPFSKEDTCVIIVYAADICCILVYATDICGILSMPQSNEYASVVCILKIIEFGTMVEVTNVLRSFWCNEK